MGILRSIGEALLVILIIIALFGVPLIPCYLIWWFVGSPSGWLALATIIVDIVIYIFAWFITLIGVIAATN